VGLERGPLSLLRITGELFQGNSDSSLETLNSPSSRGRSVGIVRLRTTDHKVLLLLQLRLFPPVELFQMVLKYAPNFPFLLEIHYVYVNICSSLLIDLMNYEEKFKCSYLTTFPQVHSS
jgi:hypothetical protein